MSEWNNNNLACLKTWIHLKILNQHDKVFKETGDLRINQLTFWNQAATPDLRSAAASTICYQLDNMFRLFDKALYEFNSNRSKAVECMHEIMTSEDKTILELAKVVDDNYKFRGEIEDEALL